MALLALAAGKYKMQVSSASVVGNNVQLPAGAYTIELRGTIAMFINEDKGTSFTAPAKVETVEAKYEATTAETSKDGNLNRIKAIRLGGTTTRLNFE